MHSIAEDQREEYGAFDFFLFNLSPFDPQRVIAGPVGVIGPLPRTGER